MLFERFLLLIRMLLHQPV